jgi:chorismate synthase
MLRMLTAGESHGPCLTAIIEGMPAGLTVNIGLIDRDLARRQGGYGRGDRMNIEQDRARILSGVLYGKTTGAPITLEIQNRDWDNWKDRWENDGLPQLNVPRPGHADYPGMVKYCLDDARLVLERASARETAARVAVGGLAKQLLSVFEIKLGSFVSRIGNVTAAIPDLSYEDLWSLAEKSDVHCPDHPAAQRMRAAIDTARRRKDTLGGLIVLVATGLPVGLGTHVQWDRRLDARLAAAVMSIQAVKGIEIGPAFENTTLMGTKVHDEMYPDTEGGVTRKSNRAGGIEGGMSNGEPVVITAAIKPIPTTGIPLASVNLETGQPESPQYQRSDICVVPAASVVGEAMIAWVLAEALVEKFGGDSLEEMTR